MKYERPNLIGDENAGYTIIAQRPTEFLNDTHLSIVMGAKKVRNKVRFVVWTHNHQSEVYFSGAYYSTYNLDSEKEAYEQALETFCSR